MRKEMTISTFLFAFVFLLFLWSLSSWVLNVGVFPSPFSVGAHVIEGWSPELFFHLGVSLYRIVTSLLLSLVMAVPLGIFLGRVSLLDRFFSPVLYLLYPIPKIVLLPILLVLLGMGDLSKILLISIIVFFQILVTVRDAAKAVSVPLIHSISSLGASRIHLYRHVIFPACLPKIFTCLRISLGTALAVLFLTETYATRVGIGFYIMDAMTRFDYPDVFSGIVAISLMGFILFLLLETLEQRFCSWNQLKSLSS